MVAIVRFVRYFVFYTPVINIRTDIFGANNSHDVFIFYVYYNRQPLFSYAPFPDWDLQWKNHVFSVWCDLNLCISCYAHLFVFEGLVVLQEVSRLAFISRIRWVIFYVKYKSDKRSEVLWIKNESLVEFFVFFFSGVLFSSARISNSVL